jgi:hypothetical protein
LTADLNTSASPHQSRIHLQPSPDRNDVLQADCGAVLKAVSINPPILAPANRDWLNSAVLESLALDLEK